jgi:hypothetical protein
VRGYNEQPTEDDDGTPTMTLTGFTDQFGGAISKAPK